MRFVVSINYECQGEQSGNGDDRTEAGVPSSPAPLSPAISLATPAPPGRWICVAKVGRICRQESNPYVFFSLSLPRMEKERNPAGLFLGSMK